MKKYILTLIFLFISFLILTSCSILKGRNLSTSEQQDIYNKAVSYLEEKHPEFKPEKEHMYVAQNKKVNKWFVYIFDQRDKGLGYEIYNDNGAITDNFDKTLFEKRLELIEYMNELMPENKQYNEYVGFNPYGSNKAKSYSQGGMNDGRVEYIVVANHIDIKKQLEIDYLILKKSNELLAAMNEPENGNWVKYYEASNIDIKFYISKNKDSYEYLKKNRERSLLTSEFFNKESGASLIGEYRLGEWNSKKEEADKKRDEALSSFDNYKNQLKIQLNSYNKSSKEKNKIVLQELLTSEEKQEIADKLKEKETKSNFNVNEKYILNIKKYGKLGESVISPDGKQIACIAEYSKKVLIIDMKTGETIRELKSTGLINLYDMISSISFSPDGKYLAGGNFNNNIDIWEVSTGKVIKTLKGHESKIQIISYSPDGKSIASAAEDIKLKIWSTESWKNTIDVHQNQQYTLCFSPDGKFIICGNEVFDVGTGEIVKKFDKFREIKCFSPDGKYVAASGQSDDEIKIINFETGELVRTLKGHASFIHTICFNPTGEYLASASNDETVKIWNVATGEMIDSLEEEGTGYALSAEYNSDGKKLVVGWMKAFAIYNVE